MNETKSVFHTLQVFQFFLNLWDMQPLAYFPKRSPKLMDMLSGCTAPISPGLGPLHWEYTGLTVGPLVLMMAHILRGIISLSLCNITTLTSIHSRTFHKALASMMGYSDHRGRFPAHPQSSPWD